MSPESYELMATLIILAVVLLPFLALLVRVRDDKAAERRDAERRRQREVALRERELRELDRML